VRSIKSECLNWMIFFGQTSLQHAIRPFIAHYHTERNHRGLYAPLTRWFQCHRRKRTQREALLAATKAVLEAPPFAAARGNLDIQIEAVR
jgi:hypothetical protein